MFYTKQYFHLWIVSIKLFGCGELEKRGENGRLESGECGFDFWQKTVGFVWDEIANARDEFVWVSTFWGSNSKNEIETHWLSTCKA